MKRTTILLLIIILNCLCGDVFFPKTGVPINSFLKRATPEGVVDQLMEAYESKRIDLLEDLLAEDFQFYVAPSFESYYKDNFEPEKPDTALEFVVNQDYYYYWKRKQELERTKVMFAKTISSEFLPPKPYITGLIYTITSSNDTTSVELKLSDGVLKLVFNGQEDEYVDVDNQVFYLQKDFDGLWVIRKWYDLSIY